MEAEDRKKLDRALSLADENNRMLKKLLRNMRWGRLFRIAYWTVIIAASIGAFYLFQPYIDGFKEAYDTFEGTVGNVNGFLSR